MCQLHNNLFFKRSLQARERGINLLWDLLCVRKQTSGISSVSTMTLWGTCSKTKQKINREIMLPSKSNVNTQNSFYFCRLVFWRWNLKIKPANKWLASLVGNWHCLIDLRVKEIEILLLSPQFENLTFWMCHFKAMSLTFLSSHIAVVEIQQ